MTLNITQPTDQALVSALPAFIREMRPVINALEDPETTYNVKAYGAVGDGVTDDTEAIQDAIDAASAAGGGTVYFPGASTYLLSTKNGTNNVFLRPRSNVNIVGAGNSSVLKVADDMNASGNVQFHVIGFFDDDANAAISGCLFADFKIDCNGANNAIPTGEAATHFNYCIALVPDSTESGTVKDITIRNVTVVNNPGRNCIVAFMKSHTGYAHGVLENIKVLDCTFRDLGDSSPGGTNQTDHSAVYLHGNNHVVRGNVLINTTASTKATAIEIQSSYTAVFGNTVSNFKHGVNIGAEVDNNYGTLVGANTFYNVERLTRLYNDTGYVLAGLKFIGNVAYQIAAGNAGDFVDFRTLTVDAHDITFENNVIVGAPSASANAGAGINVGKVINMVIRGNIIKNFMGHGIASHTGTSDAYVMVIENNELRDCGQSTDVNYAHGIVLSTIGYTQLRIVNNHLVNTSTVHMATGIASAGATQSEAYIAGNTFDNVTTHIDWDSAATKLFFNQMAKGTPNNAQYASAGSLWIDIDNGSVYKKTTSAAAKTGWRREEWGVAAPSAGIHYQGDVTWHTAPAAGGNIGWVCTTSGTPGTWKTFGTVAS